VQGAVWSPNGKEIWFSGADAGSDRAVFAVDMSGKLRPLLRVPGDFLLQDILPDGRLLGVRMEGRREINGKAPNDKEERELSWMDWGIPRDITPDGKTYLFEEEGNGGGKDYSVYMRATDGSAAVKLTNFGLGAAISSDAKWAIITRNTTPQQMYLVPTGAGDPVQLVQDDRDYFSARFLPDSKSIVYCSNVPAHPARCFRMNLDDRKVVALAPENTVFQRVISADGKSGIMQFEKHQYIWPLDGSWADKSPNEVAPIPGTIGSDYLATAFAPDGNLIATKRGPGEALPRKAYRYNLKTGEAKFWRSFGPIDVTGVPAVSPPLLSRDLNAYVFIYARELGQLFTVEGLK
jgi:dipeptidyl aminopeptidase/acylaminoacyl peptidase